MLPDGKLVCPLGCFSLKVDPEGPATTLFIFGAAFSVADTHLYLEETASIHQLISALQKPGRGCCAHGFPGRTHLPVLPVSPSLLRVLNLPMSPSSNTQHYPPRRQQLNSQFSYPHMRSRGSAPLSSSLPSHNRTAVCRRHWCCRTTGAE